MRRWIALLLPLVFVFTACTARSGGLQISPQGSRASTAALETVAIRETVRDFLDAYARSGETVQPLRGMVGGPELRDWVHWLGVQNRHLVRATGDLEVRAIRVLQVREDVAAAALDATVTFRFVTEKNGQASSVPRSFQSPVILTRGDRAGSWLVVDVVRDGRSMMDSIILLDPPVSVREEGLVVQVVSVYRFTSGTVVNMRMRSVGSQRIRIDRERSVLQVTGRSLRPLGTTRTLSGTLPHDELVQGAFDFGGLGLTAVPEGMLIRFHGNREPLALPFPPEAFAQEP